MISFDESVDINDLITFAKAYGKLGWAVQEQFDDLLRGETNDLNDNAVTEIDVLMGDMHPDIRDAIDSYLS